MGAKGSRHEAIRNIVRSARPATQAQLASLLRSSGFEVTQTTVSRDLAELGLRKAGDGRYELSEDTHLKRMCADLVRTVATSESLVIVKTFAGTAQGVAAALDGAGVDGVLGSVAGDDTILVVASGRESAQRVAQLLRHLSGKEG